MIANETADLSSELESLRRIQSPLAASLSACVENLSERTVAEIDELVDRLKGYASRLDALVSAVQPWMPSAADANTIEDVEAAIESRDRVLAARAVVERVLRIRSAGGTRNVSSTQWFADGVRLDDALERNEIDATTTAALADGRHPLCALADLVDRQEDFDDRAWQFRYDAIRDGYGAEVAVAVARGRYEAVAHDPMHASTGVRASINASATSDAMPADSDSDGAPATQSHHPTTW